MSTPEVLNVEVEPHSPARLPAPEAVVPSPDDSGFLHALPLVIAADLVLLAVVAAAWISFQ